MTKDTSGPAFSCDRVTVNGGVVCTTGLTKREYFAGLAMQGMLCDGFIPNMLKPEVSALQSYNYARAAFAMADAMIAEGSK